MSCLGGSSVPIAAPPVQTEASATATEVPISPLFPTGRFIQSGKGEYRLTFNADGTYTADDTTFTETSNTGGCNTNVRFNYTFDGKNLTFTYADNPEDDRVDCDGRYADFNNVTYILAEE